MRKREADQPRQNRYAEVETVPEVADSNGQAVNGQECQGCAVVTGRGGLMKDNYIVLKSTLLNNNFAVE